MAIVNIIQFSYFLLYRMLAGLPLKKMAHSIISAMKSRPFTVLVEGNIGSGKTTYLEHFRQFEDITLLTEPVEAWRNLSGWNLLVCINSNITCMHFKKQNVCTGEISDSTTHFDSFSLHTSKFCYIYIQSKKNHGWFYSSSIKVQLKIFIFVNQQCTMKLLTDYKLS